MNGDNQHALFPTSKHPTAFKHVIDHETTLKPLQVSWLYGVALGCTFCGLLVYNASPSVNQALIPSHLDSGRLEEEESSIIFHPEVCLSHDGSVSEVDGDEDGHTVFRSGLFGGNDGGMGAEEGSRAEASMRRASA